MLTIYGKALSRAARCLWVLEDIGLAYTHIPLDPQKGETRDLEFLRLNPSGKIPVLVDGDFVLTESIAIAGYLASLQPTPLLPDNPRVRAEIAQWSSWAVAELEPPVTRLVRARRDAAGAGQALDATLAQSAAGEIAAALTTLERHLAGGTEYCVAGEFTLADINVAGAVMAAPLLIDMAEFPGTGAWLARIFARPAWHRIKALA